MRPSRLVLCAVIGSVLLASLGAGTTTSAGIPLLPSSVASAISTVSGEPVHIRCEVLHGGYIDVMGHSDRRLRLIELHPTICLRLDRLAAQTSPPGTPAFLEEGEALLVAVHEAVHLSPYGSGASEALVECRAVQLVATVAERIGLDEARAAALGHAALGAHERLPGAEDWRVGLHELPSYQSPDCYDGGPLDIHPTSSDWPN